MLQAGVGGTVVAGAGVEHVAGGGRVVSVGDGGGAVVTPKKAIPRKTVIAMLVFILRLLQR